MVVAAKFRLCVNAYRNTGPLLFMVISERLVAFTSTVDSWQRTAPTYDKIMMFKIGLRSSSYQATILATRLPYFTLNQVMSVYAVFELLCQFHDFVLRHSLGHIYLVCTHEFARKNVGVGIPVSLVIVPNCCFLKKLLIPLLSLLFEVIHVCVVIPL